MFLRCSDKFYFCNIKRIYFEAMGLAVPSFDDSRTSYDGFMSVPGTFPQSPEEVKSSIDAIKK